MEILLHFTLTIMIVILIIMLLYTLRLIKSDLDSINATLKSMRNNVEVKHMHEYSKNDVLATAAFYQKTRQAMKEYTQNTKHPNKRVDDVIVDNHEQAEAVITALKNVIDSFDIVMLDDFHDLLGMPSIAEDTNWGWNSMDGAVIELIDKGKCVIKLPPMSHVSTLTQKKSSPNNPTVN